jgi:CRP-like cAMP-binding protein
VRERLLADASVFEVPQRRVIFRASGGPRVGFVLAGLACAYLEATNGRRVTVRLARAGEMVGEISAESTTPAPLGVAAVTDCTLLELDLAVLLRLIEVDPRVGAALVEELARRLRVTYMSLAAKKVGSIKERVAWRLLDLTFDSPADGRPIVRATPEQLADNVGATAEIVGRVLHEFRAAGIVIGTHDELEIADPVRLAGIASRGIVSG